VQPDAPSVTKLAQADDDKPVVQEKMSEPASNKPPTGTGPNEFQPATRPKTGWRPGDLLRSLFSPKPVTEPNGSTPAADPTPSTDAHEPAGDAESGSAA
jgi:hypothetical protein